MARFIVNAITLTKTVIFILFARLALCFCYGFYKHASNVRIRNLSTKRILGLQSRFKKSTLDNQAIAFINSWKFFAFSVFWGKNAQVGLNKSIISNIFVLDEHTIPILRLKI